MKYDAIVVGSGHNGLVTACYLAREGWSVCVLERQEQAGGAVQTETMFRSEGYPEGFRVDTGSSVHIMIHQTGILEELALEEYGLEYIDMDPMMSYPLPEEEGVIHFFRDLERTADSIARISPADAENYRSFVDFWGRVNEGVMRTFLKPPTGRHLATEMLRGPWSGGGMFAKGDHMDGLQKILSPYGKVVDDAFEHPAVKAALTWFAAQSGPTPDHPATGDFAGWQSMLHRSGAKHPRGGSGMLTQALKGFLEDHGGTLRTATPVEKILVEEGAVRGVRAAGGEEIAADTVISNAHVQTTMMRLVGAGHLDPDFYRKVENINVGNGFGMVIRCAVEELPEYRACPGDPHIHKGMQLLAPSVDYMNRAIGDYRAGRTPEEPAVLAMTFSAIDDDVAPSGGHTLFAWAQWHPYELAGGVNWDDIREREADRIWSVLTRYAPNLEGGLIDRYIQTPLDIERKHAMPRGNVMHVEMSLDQMFLFRPLPEMSDYRTPVDGLYLSSASCHPGGGVFGAAGRNAARMVLRDHSKTRWF
ncbi:MAG: NAD(P)/FAD-dependent oxidoreductase [Balneolaceae bacterium]|nr:NAD(P)/FAD-dependent oxidoreductase [Balneolaceae bacterium]